jgi:hypothetical protein
MSDETRGVVNACNQHMVEDLHGSEVIYKDLLPCSEMLIFSPSNGGIADGVTLIL